MASQKFGFVTVDPVSGSGDQAVNFSGEKHTGRLQRTINLTVTTNGGAKKALVVNQAAAAEAVKSDSPNASVQKTGGNVTITGKSNSTKLTFAVTPAEENGLTLQLPANYTAAGKKVNGSLENRLPGNVNFSFEFIEGEGILLMLDMLGIAASSGSACTSGSLDPSHVLMAIGLPHEIAHGSLRLSIGDFTTEEDIDYIIEKLPAVIERLRMMSPLYDAVTKQK